MAAGSTGKQVQLLFLDPVFHIPSLTVQIVIQRLRVTGQIGYYKAGIRPLAVILGLDDYPTFSVPGCRSVLGFGEDSLLLASLLEFYHVYVIPLRSLPEVTHPGFCLGGKGGVCPDPTDLQR